MNSGMLLPLRGTAFFLSSRLFVYSMYDMQKKKNYDILYDMTS